MISFNEERISEMRELLEPLLEEHYKEVAMYQDHIDLNPNWEAYEAMEEIGNTRMYAMWRDEELIGYNVFFVTPHMHYQDHEYAVNDVVYIHPDYRGTECTPEFFNYCEEMLQKEGISVISYHMKTFKPFQSLMEALEYDHAEHVYMKYVG